jgi:hypothetical protein
MSHVQSLQVFHEFAIQNLGEMCGIFALFLLFFYYLLLKSDYSDAFDDNEEEEEDEDEEEEVKDDEEEDEDEDMYELDEVEDDIAFIERLDHVQTTLLKQLELMQKLNRIEQMCEQIEAEKAKGNILDRLEAVENKKLVYKFNIAYFNNFCKSVYEEVESDSRIKKRSYIIKKLGKMWRNMEEKEKSVYSY